MSFVAFQTTIFIIMVAAFSSLLTHSYLINSYQSFIGHLFLFLIVVASLYKSRKFAWISIVTISVLYSVLQLKIYSQNLQTDINISVQYFSLFLIVGILISEISHRMKYILPGLEHLDLVDKKTGVWNKDNITSLVRTNIERHKRYNRNFSVVLFELQNDMKLTGRLLKK
ncbi:MAG: hypothetical protein KAS39_08545, partial [Actinomycetia bacterium]|nr:hypothetical protein [Actinomycetes bacterium]